MGRTASRRVPASVRWLAVALVAGVILVASVLPRSTGVAPPAAPGPVAPVGADKWLHALAYAGLAGALLYAQAVTQRSPPWALALALAVAVGFGLAVELVQAPLPTRRFELLDVVANGAGAALTVAVWWSADRVLRASSDGVRRRRG